MGQIEQFEDIEAWQKARELTNEIRKKTTSEKFDNDHALMDQLQRATYSIMLNIAEGYGRETDAEFKQFLIQSRGSAREVQSILHIAHDATYLSKKEFDDFYSRLDEIAKMISGLIQYLKD